MDDPIVVLWVLGILFLFIESWYLSHLYKEDRYFNRKDSYEKIPFKRLHLILLVLLNMVPIANVIGLIVILLIPAVETDIKLKIISPNEEDDKPSKLDKWLNKSI